MPRAQPKTDWRVGSRIVPRAPTPSHRDQQVPPFSEGCVRSLVGAPAGQPVQGLVDHLNEFASLRDRMNLADTGPTRAEMRAMLLVVSPRVSRLSDAVTRTPPSILARLLTASPLGAAVGAHESRLTVDIEAINRLRVGSKRLLERMAHEFDATDSSISARHLHVASLHELASAAHDSLMQIDDRTRVVLAGLGYGDRVRDVGARDTNAERYQVKRLSTALETALASSYLKRRSVGRRDHSLGTRHFVYQCANVGAFVMQLAPYPSYDSYSRQYGGRVLTFVRSCLAAIGVELAPQQVAEIMNYEIRKRRSQ